MSTVRVVTFTCDAPETVPPSLRHIGMLFDGKGYMPIRIHAASADEARERTSKWWKNEIEKIRTWPRRAKAKAQAAEKPAENAEADAAPLTEMRTDQEHFIPAPENGGIVAPQKAKRLLKDDDLL